MEAKRYGGALTAAILVVSGGLPVMAGGATPTCFGKPATIVGTPGDDTLVGTNGDDVIYGDGGRDTIRGRGGNDRLCGAGGDLDRVAGNAGSDKVSGGSGGDVLYGGQGADVMKGGGRGRVSELGDRLFGGTGNDNMTGTTAANIYTAGPGKDRINETGGSPFDALIYASAAHGVKVDLRRGLARGEGRDLIEGVERLAGSPHDDILLGNGMPNVIVGNGGDDIASGRGRSDIFDRTDTLWQPTSKRSGRGNDRLFGGDGKDGFTAAGPEKDHVFGEGGNDGFLIKNDWRASLNGGAGKDTLELLRAGASRILLRDGIGKTAEGAMLTLEGIEDINGSRGNDVLRGDAKRNVIKGMNGNDSLRGRRGNDVLLGGDGDNSIDGGKGTDTCHNPSPSQGATGCENP